MTARWFRGSPRAFDQLSEQRLVGIGYRVGTGLLLPLGYDTAGPMAGGQKVRFLETTAARIPQGWSFEQPVLQPLTSILPRAMVGSEMRSYLIACIAVTLVYASSRVCFAQSTKTIDCPLDRVHLDTRQGGGGQEFCEHLLPGSLAVKDGPFRFWFNSDFEGAAGNYNEGR